MTQAIRIAADDTLSPVRALYSLTPAQADQIVAGLSSLALTWDIERHESCDGHLSLVLAHTAYDAAIIVGHDTKGIHVSLMLGDALHTSPCRYPSTDAFLSAIKAIVGDNVMGHQRHSA